MANLVSLNHKSESWKQSLEISILFQTQTCRLLWYDIAGTKAMRSSVLLDGI